MSTQISAADVIAIDINGHSITIVPSQQLITCNIEQALGWQWNTCFGLVSWRWIAIDGITHSFFSFNQIQYMAEKLNKQIPTILHKYIYPLTRHDDKENQIMTTNQLTAENNSQKFHSDLFGDLTTLAHQDGTIWFIGMEVAEKLGYEDAHTMYRRMDNEDKQVVNVKDFATAMAAVTNSKARTMILINESGLYAAVLGSKKSEAKEFKRWVTKEVIPSIRKTGGYGQAQVEQKPEPVKTIRHTNASAMRAADRMIEKMTISDERKTLARAYLLHKEYDIPVETMLPAVTHKLNATEIGKQLGISANMVGRITNELGIKNDSALCELRLDKSPHGSKQIETCYYALSVIDMVKAKLNERKAS